MLLVDTGATDTMLTRFGTDKRAMQRHPTTAYVTGVGGSSQLYEVPIRSFAVGPIKSRDRGMLHTIDEMGSRPEVDAIIGSSFLMQVDMELSLAEKAIKFFEPQDCEKTYLGYWIPDAVELPILYDNDHDHDRPVVEVALNGVKLRALIDTGATHSSVTRAAARRAGLALDAAGVTRRGEAVGIGSKRVDSYQGTFKSFEIGHEQISNPMLGILDYEADDHDVILGTDFLRSHRVLFAVSQKKIYLSYVGGPPFHTGKLDPWIEQEAKAGNSYAQVKLAATLLDSGDAAAQAAGGKWMQDAVASKNPLALRYLARLLAHEGKHQESVAMYEQLLAKDPHDMTAQFEAFTMRLTAGQADAAKPALVKAMANFRWPPWPAPISDYYLGKISLEQLLKAARGDSNTAKRRQCEVLRHAHALQDALGQREPAAALATRAKAECDVNLADED